MKPYAKQSDDNSPDVLIQRASDDYVYGFKCSSPIQAGHAVHLLNNRHSEDFLHDVAIATAAYTDGIDYAVAVDPNAFDWEAFNGWLSGGGMIETRYTMVEWAKKDAELQAHVCEYFSRPGVWSYEVSEEVGAAAVEQFLNQTVAHPFPWWQHLGDRCLAFVCRDADHNQEEVIARIQEVLPEWQRPPKPDLKQAAHDLANTVADGMDAVMLREMLYSLQRSHVDTNNDLKILIDAVLNKPSREITAVTTQLAEKYGVPTEE